MADCLLTPFSTAFTSVGIGFSDFMLIVVFIVGLMAYARDVRVGVITHEVLYSLLFLWFYNAQYFSGCDYNWVKPLAMTIVFFVVMVLLVFPTSKVAQRGGVV